MGYPPGAPDGGGGGIQDCGFGGTGVWFGTGGVAAWGGNGGRF